MYLLEKYENRLKNGSEKNLIKYHFSQNDYVNKIIRPKWLDNKTVSSALLYSRFLDCEGWEEEREKKLWKKLLIQL